MTKSAIVISESRSVNAIFRACNICGLSRSCARGLPGPFIVASSLGPPMGMSGPAQGG